MLPSILVCVMVLLVMVSASLFLQNKHYRQENRELIIQNDSIMSVNIELKSALNGGLSNPVKKTSFQPKKEKHQ